MRFPYVFSLQCGRTDFVDAVSDCRCAARTQRSDIWRILSRHMNHLMPILIRAEVSSATIEKELHAILPELGQGVRICFPVLLNAVRATAVKVITLAEVRGCL